MLLDGYIAPSSHKKNLESLHKTKHFPIRFQSRLSRKHLEVNMIYLWNVIVWLVKQDQMQPVRQGFRVILKSQNHYQSWWTAATRLFSENYEQGVTDI